jgi:hypothetical protein
VETPEIAHPSDQRHAEVTVSERKN